MASCPRGWPRRCALRPRSGTADGLLSSAWSGWGRRRRCPNSGSSCLGPAPRARVGGRARGRPAPTGAGAGAREELVGVLSPLSGRGRALVGPSEPPAPRRRAPTGAARGRGAGRERARGAAIPGAGAAPARGRRRVPRGAPRGARRRAREERARLLAAEVGVRDAPPVPSTRSGRGGPARGPARRTVPPCRAAAPRRVGNAASGSSSMRRARGRSRWFPPRPAARGQPGGRLRRPRRTLRASCRRRRGRAGRHVAGPDVAGEGARTGLSQRRSWRDDGASRRGPSSAAGRPQGRRRPGSRSSHAAATIAVARAACAPARSATRRPSSASDRAVSGRRPSQRRRRGRRGRSRCRRAGRGPRGPPGRPGPRLRRCGRRHRRQLAAATSWR